MLISCTPVIRRYGIMSNYRGAVNSYRAGNFYFLLSVLSLLFTCDYCILKPKNIWEEKR